MGDRRGFRGGLIAVATMAGLLGGGAAQAGASGYAVTKGCDEQQAFVAGDDAAVTAWLPAAYRPVREPASGAPVLFVRAIRCDEIWAGERAAKVTMASYGVVIESPDGRGCASGSPLGTARGDNPPICNWYTGAWLADDRRVARWLRGRGGFPARFSDDLAFRLGERDARQGGAPFSFRATADGIRFGIDATTRERPGTLSVRGGYWADTPEGTAKVAFSTQDLVSGNATGTVTAAAGTELARLLGAGERPYLPAYSEFAAERWGQAIYRHQLLAPGGDSFHGTCAVQGEVVFTPPATYEERALRYVYDAQGTCSGRLGTRDVTDAPVRLHHEGSAYASCARATTTTPGIGTLSFADGTTIHDTLDFTGTGTEVDMTLYGDRSGTARGKGTFRTARTEPGGAARCGQGLERAPFDLTIATETPLVSDRRAGGGKGSEGGAGDGRAPSGRAPSGRPPSPGGPPNGAPGEAPAGAPRLRLRVAPRAARAGRRTRFVFRVRTASGAPVRGAVVRFAGRRAVTGRRGRATITATVARAGRRPARAERRGFRTARTRVRIR